MSDSNASMQVDVPIRLHRVQLGQNPADVAGERRQHFDTGIGTVRVT